MILTPLAAITFYLDVEIAIGELRRLLVKLPTTGFTRRGSRRTEADLERAAAASAQSKE